MSARPRLRVLDGAQEVVDDINQLLKSRRLPNAAQLRDAAESITANIQEAFGRDAGPDRNQFLRFARASAEEASERLRVRFRAKDISAKVYWPLHHRLVAVSRMLTNLMSKERQPDLRPVRNSHIEDAVRGPVRGPVRGRRQRTPSDDPSEDPSEDAVRGRRQRTPSEDAVRGRR